MAVLGPLDANCHLPSIASTSAFTLDDDFDVDIFANTPSCCVIWSGSPEALSSQGGCEAGADHARSEREKLSLELQQVAREVRRRREEDERRQGEGQRAATRADEEDEPVECATVKGAKTKSKANAEKSTKKRKSEAAAAEKAKNKARQAAERAYHKAQIAAAKREEKEAAAAEKERRKLATTASRGKRKADAESRKAKGKATTRRRTSMTTLVAIDKSEEAGEQLCNSGVMSFIEGVFSRNISAFAFVDGGADQSPVSPESAIDRPLQLPPSNQSVKRYTRDALLPPATPVGMRCRSKRGPRTKAMSEARPDCGVAPHPRTAAKQNAPITLGVELIAPVAAPVSVAGNVARKKAHVSVKDDDSSDAWLDTSTDSAWSHDAAHIAQIADATVPREMIFQPGVAPVLPEELKTTLRELDRCPVCGQGSWPTLIIDEHGRVARIFKRVRRKKSVKLAVVTGPARMLHVRLCALQSQTPIATVMELVRRDMVTLNRNRRLRHIEALRTASTWKELVGESPPCTQVQQQAVRQMNLRMHDVFVNRNIHEGMRYQRRGMIIPKFKKDGSLFTQQAAKVKAIKSVTKKKTMAQEAPMKRIGVHGGIDRETTTVVAPKRDSSAAKRVCSALFGPPAEQTNADGEEPWREYDLSEQGFHIPFASIRGRRRGLGVGVCCATEDAHDPRKFFTAESRLSRGNIMGATMARAIGGERMTA